MADSIKTGEQVVGAAMAITPFLPPPFGLALTGALSVANLVMGIVKDSQSGPTGPLPLDLAVQSIENYIKDTVLKVPAGSINASASWLAHSVNNKEFKADIANLSSISELGDVPTLLESPYTPQVVFANGQLYEALKTNQDTWTLSLLISGITTQLLLYHAQVAIGALDAAIQYRHQDLDQYRTAVHAWTGVAERVAKDIGKTHDGPWTDEQIIDAMSTATAGYIPRIEAWMAKNRKERLTHIHGPTRVYGTFSNSYQDGWTYTDEGSQGPGGDDGAYYNLIKDSVCGWRDDRDDPSVWHKDEVQANMNAYISKIGHLTDVAFAPYRTVMASWTTYIADLRALLPPATPPQPTVGAPLPGGTATPSGTWNSGQQVRYALMARSGWNPSVQSELEERLRKSGFNISEVQSNKKGPSASEWSQPLTIGPTVGAVVGGITDVDGADTLVVLRQFRTNTAAAWSDSQQVAALARPFPPTYTDTNPGGDSW